MLGRARRSGNSGSRAGVAVGVVAVLLSACGFREPANEPITVLPLTRVEVPPVTGKTGAMDIIDIDHKNNRLYVTDGTDFGIDVIDTSVVPGKYIKTIHIGSLTNGVVAAPDINRVFAGSDDSALIVISTNQLSPRHRDRVIANIPVNGTGASDLVEYDPDHHKVFLTNPDDGFISVFDARTFKLIDTIRNIGLVDQPRYDPANGMLFVSQAERNSILKIDAKSDKVVGESPIPVTCEPHGLAVDPSTNLGIIGCNDKDEVRTLAWDFNRNKMVRSFDQAGAGDQVIFDPMSKRFYFAASSYSPPVVAVFASLPTSIAFLTGVPTSHRSKGVAYDEKHRWIYSYDGKHREAGVWGFPDPHTDPITKSTSGVATIPASAGK